MAISTRAQLMAAMQARQQVKVNKTAQVTGAAANTIWSMFSQAGNPGGVSLMKLALDGNTITDTFYSQLAGVDQGVPRIGPFDVGKTGYITRVEASNTQPGRIFVYDLLWYGGSYGALIDHMVVLNDVGWQSRVPNGDFKSVEMWCESAASYTGNFQPTIYYNDGAGNPQTTSQDVPGFNINYARRMPTANSLGVERITRVVEMNGSIGSFNILLMRKLWEGNIRFANEQIISTFDQTGLRQIYEHSAVVVLVTPNATGTGTPEVVLDVVNG